MTVRTGATKARRLLLTKLRLSALADGSTVRLSCNGVGCHSPRATTVTVKGGSVNLLRTKTVRGRLLAKNTLLKIRITAPDHTARTLYYVAK